MDIKIVKEKNISPWRSLYVVDIYTESSEGSPDNVRKKFKVADDRMREYIRYAEILKNEFPSTNRYLKFNFFKEIFIGNWMASFGDPYTMHHYEVRYFDDQGRMHEVKVELNEEDLEFINSYKEKD